MTVRFGQQYSFSWARQKKFHVLLNLCVESKHSLSRRSAQNVVTDFLQGTDWFVSEVSDNGTLDIVMCRTFDTLRKAEKCDAHKDLNVPALESLIEKEVRYFDAYCDSKQMLLDRSTEALIEIVFTNSEALNEAAKRFIREINTILKGSEGCIDKDVFMGLTTKESESVMRLISAPLVCALGSRIIEGAESLALQPDSAILHEQARYLATLKTERPLEEEIPSGLSTQRK